MREGRKKGGRERVKKERCKIIMHNFCNVSVLYKLHHIMQTVVYFVLRNEHCQSPEILSASFVIIPSTPGWFPHLW